MSRRSGDKKNLIVGSIVLSLLLTAGIAFYVIRVVKKPAIIVEETGSQSIGKTIEYNGQRYTYNTNLTNILFLGIDNNDPISRFSDPTHAGQSDAIFLLTLNNLTKEASILEINRNSMTELDIFNSSGELIYTVDGQITLQYAYGTGGSHSCWATKNTVSQMLYDLPIDGYFVMNLSGINTFNDAIGGVDVLMPRDYSIINPVMTSGATVHIEGDMAERFVRWRDLNQFNSVSDRMERQALYITALLDNLSNRDTSSMYNIISPYINDIILTNLEADEFNSLSNYSYEGVRIDLIPGEMIDTDLFEEYIIDEDALLAFVVENYYVPVE